MRLLKILLYIGLAFAALIFLPGLFGKREMHVERSAVINAPKDLVFDQIRYYYNFRKWSPWEALDPDMAASVAGEDGKTGAVYSWKGKEGVGSGSMKTTAIEPNLMKIDLDLEQPFKTTGASFFSLHDADGGGTKVVWGMDLKLPYPWNGFAMFTDLDKAFGKDYEQGLLNLQKRCDDLVDPPKYRGYLVKEAEMKRLDVVGLRDTVAFADIPKFFETSFGKIGKALAAKKIEPTGMPFGLFYDYNEAKKQTDMVAAMPVAVPTGLAKGEIADFPLGPGRALVIEHFGAYEKTGEAHLALDEYMEEKGLEHIPPVLEEYANDPMIEKDTAKWLTRVIYFVKVKPMK